jgi:glycosyltransferase involved in cell wall biosynthesis
MLVGKLAHVPVLVWNIRCAFMDMRNYPKPSKFVVRLLTRFSGIPNVVVVNSKAGREAHTELGYRPKQFELIPNGFDLDRFCPDPSARESLRKELQLPEEAVVIGLVARHDPMKDHPTFLGAARQIRASHSCAYFVLCGSHIDEQNVAIMRLLNDYGLQDCVRLLGPRNDMPRITSAFDIACSSALGEGFCNAIGEAMSCGVPCVVTDVGDSALVVGMTGKVVPPANPEAFGKAVCELIECGQEARNRLGIQARMRIAEHFDVNVMTRRYERLYKSLLSLSQSKGNEALDAKGKLHNPCHLTVSSDSRRSCAE